MPHENGLNTSGVRPDYVKGHWKNQRRNYSQETTRSYIHAVKQFAEYFGKSPQELGAEEIRRYQLYLLNEKKYSAGTVKVHMSALRFFYKKVLKRRDLSFDAWFTPKNPRNCRWC